MTWNEDQTVADLAVATNRTIEEARERLRRALADIDDWEHEDSQSATTKKSRQRGARMISRSTNWDRFTTAIVEHLGANPKDVRPGSAFLEIRGGDQYMTFTCSFLIAASELSKIQAQIKETA